MPSATAVLNFTKTERDVLGRWSADGSDRYTRVARHRQALMQRSVASTFQSCDEMDPPAEADNVEVLDEFLKSQGIPQPESARTKELLCSST